MCHVPPGTTRVFLIFSVDSQFENYDHVFPICCPKLDLKPETTETTDCLPNLNNYWEVPSGLEG